MEDKIYCIYRATCSVNGKCYIGFSGNFKVRKGAHKKAALDNKDNAFYRAIRKHGWDSFVWDIIFESKYREYTLNEMESHFIGLQQSNDPKFGYNMTAGGDGVTGHSDKLRQKISEATKAAMAKPEVSKATSIAQKKRFEDNPESHGMAGKKHSKKSIEKMREKTMSDSAKILISQKSKEMWANPEIKAKILKRIQNPSKETRAKMSAAKKGRPSWNKGKTWAPETIEKMRTAKLGKKNPHKIKVAA